MENISIFLKGAEALGVPKHDLFQTIDLYEKKNMTQVYIKKTLRKKKTYKVYRLLIQSMLFPDMDIRRELVVITLDQSLRINKNQRIQKMPPRLLMQHLTHINTGIRVEQINPVLILDNDEILLERTLLNINKTCHCVVYLVLFKTCHCIQPCRSIKKKKGSTDNF